MDWDAPMSIKETNQMVSEIAGLLASGFDEPPIARKSKLEFSKLNFDLESLDQLDLYLTCLHGPYSNWINGGEFRPQSFEADTDSDAREFLKTTIIRIGAYVGEVIRRTARSDLNWVRHQEWSTQARKADLELIGRISDIGNAFMLFNSVRKELWLPLGKVQKCLEFGGEDSVAFFARTVCSSSSI